jgi:undecaprenyl-diphosphatase
MSGIAMEAIEAYDQGMLYYFGSLHRPWLDAAARTVTALGQQPILSLVVLAAAAGFLILRRRRAAGIVVLVAVVSAGLERSAKYLVGRDRPDVAWRLIPLPDQPSFPSGHALCSMAIYGCIGLLAARLVAPRWRSLTAASGVALAVMIGLTRPYLGVHYPLDVLAGWTAGLACALAGSALSEPPQPLDEDAPDDALR